MKGCWFQNKWLHFEDRIKQLEDDWDRHHNAVHEIKEAMRNMLSPSSSTHSLGIQKHNQTVPSLKLSKKQFSVSEMIYENSCPIQVNFIPRSNIQMLEIYKGLSFDNMDGGVWKQGWKIEVDEKDWNRHNKLKVSKSWFIFLSETSAGVSDTLWYGEKNVPVSLTHHFCWRLSITNVQNCWSATTI